MSDDFLSYVTFDYEEPGEPDNFWHIYSLDVEPESVDFGGNTVLKIKGPETQQMRDAIFKICLAINAAIKLSLKS